MTYDQWKTTDPNDNELGSTHEDDRIFYRDYIISYWMKPIPTRGNDWDWRHKDFDLDDNRYGTSASLEEAKADIDEQIEEEKFLASMPKAVRLEEEKIIASLPKAVRKGMFK
jgi:hypothetical protein